MDVQSRCVLCTRYQLGVVNKCLYKQVRLNLYSKSLVYYIMVLSLKVVNRHFLTPWVDTSDNVPAAHFYPHCLRVARTAHAPVKFDQHRPSPLICMQRMRAYPCRACRFLSSPEPRYLQFEISFAQSYSARKSAMYPKLATDNRAGSKTLSICLHQLNRTNPFWIYDCHKAFVFWEYKLIYSKKLFHHSRPL